MPLAPYISVYTMYRRSDTNLHRLASACIRYMRYTNDFLLCTIVFLQRFNCMFIYLSCFAPPPPYSCQLHYSLCLYTDINSVSSPTQVSLSPKLNDYLVLPCPIPSSVPSPTVTWSPVTLSSRVGVTLSGSLVYSYLMSGDTSSTLTCTVSNGVVGTSQVTTQVTLTYQCK